MSETMCFRQVELDLFEEKALKQLLGTFYDNGKLQINPIVRGFMRDKWQIECPETQLNQVIKGFEAFMKPCQYDNGIVSASKLAEQLRTMFPQTSDIIEIIPKRDFRLVEILDEINLQTVMDYISKIGVQ